MGFWRKCARVVQGMWLDLGAAIVVVLMYTIIIVICMVREEPYKASIVGIAAFGAAYAGVYQARPVTLALPMRLCINPDICHQQHLFLRFLVPFSWGPVCSVL